LRRGKGGKGHGGVEGGGEEKEGRRHVYSGANGGRN